MKYSAQDEQHLMTELWDPAIADDPEKFVLFAYPWGKANTPLANYQGPRTWQRDYLQEIADHIRYQKLNMNLGLEPWMWQKATASGRGPGKSALVGWLTDWMRTTRLGSTTIVTANTEPQLKSRTFAEITKWTNLSINAHWWETSVLSVRPAAWFKKLLQDQKGIDCGYYYTQGLLWSEENPDAFAGAHNPLGIMVIFDEASGIPQPIFTVTEGFFTEPVLDRYWNVFSNPRRNSGGFFDCFHAHKAFWRRRQIDSRTVEGTDKQRYAELIAKHGDDSDVVRVEVLGKFPKQGTKQFISNALVAGAQRRELQPDPLAALIMGVDVARYGDDESVIRFRQGRDARSLPPIRFKDRDNMFIANEVAKAILLYRPDAVCIDAGNGTGVIDRLREMKFKVYEVWFGKKANEPEWADRRTEMYANVRDWLGGGCIDNDPRLFTDLTAPEYYYFGKAADQIRLQTKEEIKDETGRSPDDGDALALTFAVKVARRDLRASRTNPANFRVARDVNYPIFG